MARYDCPTCWGDRYSDRGHPCPQCDAKGFLRYDYTLAPDWSDRYDLRLAKGRDVGNKPTWLIHPDPLVEMRHYRRRLGVYPAAEHYQSARRRAMRHSEIAA